MDDMIRSETAICYPDISWGWIGLIESKALYVMSKQKNNNPGIGRYLDIFVFK